MKELVLGGQALKELVAEILKLQDELPEEIERQPVEAQALRESAVDLMLMPLLIPPARGRTVGQILQCQKIEEEVQKMKDAKVYAVTLDDADHKFLKDEFDAFPWQVNKFQRPALFFANRIIDGAGAPKPKESK